MFEVENFTRKISFNIPLHAKDIRKRHAKELLLIIALQLKICNQPFTNIRITIENIQLDSILNVAVATMTKQS